jgi:hypothetical protein
MVVYVLLFLVAGLVVIGLIVTIVDDEVVILLLLLFCCWCSLLMVGEDKEAVGENRKIFFECLGLRPMVKHCSMNVQIRSNNKQMCLNFLHLKRKSIGSTWFCEHRLTVRTK